MDTNGDGKSTARGGSWFRHGCLGCLGLGVLGLATVLIVLMVAFGTAQPEQVEERVLVPDIPTDAGGDVARRGRVIIEVWEAELRVQPVDPGERLHIEAGYDVNAFAIEEEFDPGNIESGLWTYRASFGRSAGAGAFPGLVSVVRGSTASIHLFLPKDLPIDLVLNMKGGGAVVRLGGLWLRNAEIVVESGALDLDIQEPVHEPMEHLSIRTSKGGCLLNHLGNASPRRLDVSYRLGGIDMDLGGRWLTDAEINIDGGIGGGPVHLPSGVILEGLDLGAIRVPEPADLEPPTLRFSVTTGLGYLELSDIHLREHVPRD